MEEVSHGLNDLYKDYFILKKLKSNKLNPTLKVANLKVCKILGGKILKGKLLQNFTFILNQVEQEEVVAAAVELLHLLRL